MHFYCRAYEQVFIVTAPSTEALNSEGDLTGGPSTQIS